MVSHCMPSVPEQAVLSCPIALYIHSCLPLHLNRIVAYDHSLQHRSRDGESVWTLGQSPTASP